MAEASEVVSTKYVTFKSGNEYFGIDIQYVNEIIVYQEITKIPESEDYIKGLINLRGKIIPVIDVRIRFKQEPFEYNDRTCIIIVKVKGTVVGLIVEKIAEVVEISSDNLIPSPSLVKVETLQNRYVYAIGKVGEDVKLLIDPDRLLNDDILSTLTPSDEEEEDEGEEKEETAVKKEENKAEKKAEKKAESPKDEKKQTTPVEVKEEPKGVDEAPIIMVNPMLDAENKKSIEEKESIKDNTKGSGKKEKK